MADSLPVTIFHTNDMHGRLAAMSRLSAFARAQRAAAVGEGRRVFFWDAGDAADRRVTLCSATKAAGFSPILNAMGVSLQTLGNAYSLTYGPQAIAGVAERADFPILAANCRDGASPLPAGLQEYVLLPLSESVNMGVFGLTDPWGGAYETYGLHFPPTLEVAHRVVDELREHGARVIILLSHLGLDADRDLVREVAGIDVVIGSHSHHLLPEGEEEMGTLIAQAGEYARALGRVDLRVDAESGEVLSRRARVLAVPENTPPDPSVEAAIAAVTKEVEGLLDRPVGVLKAPLKLDHFSECGLGNLAADALRDRMVAQAAIVLSGFFHAPLPEGLVTVGDVQRSCFATANPAVTSVRGDQIRAALDRGLDPEHSRQIPHGLRGTPVGIPQISGLEVEFRMDAPSGERIRRIEVDGVLLDPKGLYRLAHTDGEIAATIGCLRLEAGQESHFEVPTILGEVLEAYLREHSPVNPPAGPRWVQIEDS